MLLHIFITFILFMRCNAFSITHQISRPRMAAFTSAVDMTQHIVSPKLHVHHHTSHHHHIMNMFRSTTVCFFSGSTNNNDDDSAAGSDSNITLQKMEEKRRDRLHVHLNQLGIDAESLADAAFRSVTTTEGFDARFGKSAIKTYRSYIYPKPGKLEAIQRENVDVAANRYARQIDFLSKRHRSREAEWIRHIDTSDARRTFPLILVLDNLRSSANVGSIYRSADACGCLEVITTGITPHPNGNGAEKLSKSALGAERIVTSQHFATTKQALEYLRKERPNYSLFGMETTDNSRCYTGVQYPGSDSISNNDDEDDDASDASTSSGVALFLGNEVTGVDTDIQPLLDEMIEIPMFGTKNSLSRYSCISLLSVIVLCFDKYVYTDLLITSFFFRCCRMCASSDV